jgi:DNA repair protein RadA
MSLFIDTEGGFRPERLGEMARARGWHERGLLERIVYLRCNSAAEQSEAVRHMAKRRKTAICKLVAIDTLTRNFTLDLPGRANMPDRQGALDVHLSEMARDAFLNQRAYLMTNRVTFGVGEEDVGIGGRTVAQLVHTSLHLKKEKGQIRIEEEGGGGSCLVAIGESGIGA